MPEIVAGQQLVRGAADEAVYEQMELWVLRLGGQRETEGFPATAGKYLELLAESGEVEIETQQLDLEDDLAYLVGTGTGNGETVYVMAWGEPESEWLFSLSADSPDSRIALVNAFVVAVTASG